jgi:DNA-binding MarR family transcriptional regulator
VRITDAGRELFETTSAGTAPITARVYAGIPAEDLAAAGRVLSLVTERADAELAALPNEVVEY